MNRRLACATLLAGAAVASLALPPSAASASGSIVQMTIHNKNGDDGMAALSDRPLEDSTRYTDYRWNPAEERDICVDGNVYSTGMAYLGLNRRQGFENNLWCNQQFDGGGQPLPDRYYHLVISDETACAFLEANGLGVVSAPGTRPCVLVPEREPRAGGFQPHVRLETLFKNKAKTTRVRFQFELQDGAQYSVDADAQASIISHSANHKTVVYTGTAGLWKFGGGKIGESFYFPFTLEFLRQ